MTKKFAALFMALTILASGAAGFGGACLANYLAAPKPQITPLPEPPRTYCRRRTPRTTDSV